MDSIHVDAMCKIMCINTKKSDNDMAEQRKPPNMCRAAAAGESTREYKNNCKETWSQSSLANHLPLSLESKWKCTCVTKIICSRGHLKIGTEKLTYMDIVGIQTAVRTNFWNIFIRG